MTARVAAALEIVQPLTAGYCSVLLARVSHSGGGSVLEVYDAASGQHLDDLELDTREDHEPDRMLAVDVWDGDLVAVARARTDEYLVATFSGAGFGYPRAYGVAGGWVAALATGLADGQPVVLASDQRRVVAYDGWSPARSPARAEVRRQWSPPDGWRVEELVKAGPTTVAWLGPERQPWPSNPGPGTPADWRCWPWDAVDGAPAGRCVRIVWLPLGAVGSGRPSCGPDHAGLAPLPGMGPAPA